MQKFCEEFILSCLFQTNLVCIVYFVSKKSQIIKLCVSPLCNNESRKEYVSEVTTVSPLCLNPSVIMHTLLQLHPRFSISHSLHAAHSLHCGPPLLMKDCWGSVLKWALMPTPHIHTTMPALCHVTRLQGSSITFAQTLSQSHSKTEVWHINVKQISLTFILSNNTMMAGSQAHQPTILTF